MAGKFTGGRLVLEEIHRFATPGVCVAGSSHWDVLAIFRQVLDGLRRAATMHGGRIAGIGIDTWGVDFALLDGAGRLLGNPYQYRDPRHAAAMPAVHAMIGAERLFDETGIQSLPFNTINQLHAESLTRTGVLDAARHLLFLPDLLSYWLCGERVQERTIASTSQLWNPRTGAWSERLVGALGLPGRLFQPVVAPGTRLGVLRPEVRSDTGLPAVPVIAVGGHDTASAVAGAPLDAAGGAFMSSGTWSLLGIELPGPLITPAVRAAGYSNEAGVEGTTRLLRNICGMWLIEQLRADWMRDGGDAGYAEMIAGAEREPAFASIIDPDDPRFASPGDMAEKIRAACRESGQKTPQSRGALVRCALESLAAKYAVACEALREFAPGGLHSLRVVGGGSRNAFLNQATADALGMPVTAGPDEATSLGNLTLQLRAAGIISNLGEGRALIAGSIDEETFTPRDHDAWSEPTARLRALIASRCPAEPA
jgi:rhamnulokinase